VKERLGQDNSTDSRSHFASPSPFYHEAPNSSTINPPDPSSPDGSSSEHESESDSEIEQKPLNNLRMGSIKVETVEADPIIASSSQAHSDDDSSEDSDEDDENTSSDEETDSHLEISKTRTRLIYGGVEIFLIGDPSTPFSCADCFECGVCKFSTGTDKNEKRKPFNVIKAHVMKNHSGKTQSQN